MLIAPLGFDAGTPVSPLAVDATGEVLVRVRAAGLCHSDLSVIDGNRPIATVAEGFGLAVQLFSESSDKLTATLQRIEGALGKSMARSDEQLAYYVAQAREVIDLSLMSQQRIVGDLQPIPARQTTGASEG